MLHDREWIQGTELPKTARDRLLDDFDSCISYLRAIGTKASAIENRLSLKKLPQISGRDKWYPIDNGAKQYPIVMTHENMPMFRLSAELGEPVVPEVLQMALHFVLKRFPHYMTRLCKGFFWYYLRPDPNRYAIARDHQKVCMPLDTATEPLFRVLYDDHRISVELFHILADGTGGLIFLKSLIAEYYSLLGADVAYDRQTLNPMEHSPAADTENCFEKFKVKIKPNPMLTAPAARMPGEHTAPGGHTVARFSCSAKELTRISGKHSITALMSALVLSSCKTAAKNAEGNYKLQVPINLRDRFDMGTLRNFSWYCALALPNKQGFQEVLCHMSDQLIRATSKDTLLEQVASAQATIRLARYIPLSIKEMCMRTAYALSGEFFFTATLSNLGRIHLPEPLKSRVLSMDAALGPSVSNNVNTAMITVGDRCILSITKSTEDTGFETALLEAAKKVGIKSFERRTA